MIMVMVTRVRMGLHLGVVGVGMGCVQGSIKRFAGSRSHALLFHLELGQIAARLTHWLSGICETRLGSWDLC